MKKRYIVGLFAACVAMSSLPQEVLAQRGPSASSGDNVRTKVVRDCEYEVLPGLAEVTSVQVIRPASESALKYDEHEVLFKFTPMEGGELLEMLKDEEIEFVLRSRATRVPVGPEYIKQKQVKVGTKYAMNLLQTRNREACLERYTYESKALDNDLFEAYENIIPYVKESYERQLMNKDRLYRERKDKEADGAVNEVADPVETPTEPVSLDESEIDYGGLTPEEIANLTEEEMRKIVEENLRKRLAKNGGLPNYGGNELGIDEAKIRQQVEEQKRKEYEEQLANAGQQTLEGDPNAEVTSTTSKSQADAIREAKRRAKEAEREERLEQKRKEQEELERQRKEQEIRERIEREVEEKIQREIEEKEEAARQRQLQQAKVEAEEKKKQQQAISKMKSIEQELAERIINENKRKDCVFGDRISGVIEVVKVSKVREADISPFGFTEYEIQVTFRPDNYAELSKKDKKYWEQLFTFTLDPMGKNANPGAGYIRKYKVFKASRYQGFAQVMESGICNQVMLYAPDLPNDDSKIKLQ